MAGSWTHVVSMINSLAIDLCFEHYFPFPDLLYLTLAAVGLPALARSQVRDVMTFPTKARGWAYFAVCKGSVAMCNTECF